ncbi:alpha/beta hydrolase fold domain-containing protein [Croceicoccus naphthovorans]|uniref:alpha/beta hydrolase fold domain-containing protein n=1 Tax=Croceicoccus naphthovorans TaxID=1348774 RepID=UPI00069E6EB2|nr:alpha/beta hydrolase fold domain-containing protein [Croceicoccus naphthovorans]MBB3990952.1 acetyl esterase/lipase [Croceicoccus naphthovorans]
MVRKASIFRDEPPALRAGIEATEEQRTFRAGIPIPEGAGDVSWEIAANVDCLVASVPQPRCRIVHMHGGGYFCGSAAHYAEFATRLAQAIEAEIWVPDYCLAPENPFPAAVRQMIAVIDVLADHPCPLPIFLSGDSAGGGLALALASIMRRPLPVAGILMLSPWVDMTITSDGYSRCAQSDLLFSQEAAENAAKWYLQGEDSRHPLASPLFADLSGLPPVTILVASDEVLADDALALANRMLVSGVQFQLVAVPGVAHVWPVLNPDSVASIDADRTLRHFVDLALEGRQPLR